MTYFLPPGGGGGGVLDITLCLVIGVLFRVKKTPLTSLEQKRQINGNRASLPSCLG